MESPIVPRYPKQRLVRDYSNEDNQHFRTPPSSDIYLPKVKAQGYEVDELLPHLNDNFDLPVDEHDNPHTSSPVQNRSAPSPVVPRVPHRGVSRQPTGYHHETNPTNVHTSPQEDLRKLDFNLDHVEDARIEVGQNSEYAPSVSSVGVVSHASAITQSSNSRFPDFFASEVFQTVLHNPTTAHQLLKFSQQRLCGENLEFLQKIDRYHTLLNEVSKTLFEIHRDFISTTAQTQINLPGPLLLKTTKDLKLSLSKTLPSLESLFVDAQSDIERLVSLDIYPRFIRHQMTMSAAKALASDRTQYGGLGDCFVLTDPAKADNPIVFASDGFVKVTGYPRNEIIPRNCRFLQTPTTERAALKRLKTAIENRKESVELLLNQKKTGEPFWNLLYTTPLFDARGNVVFFLGGQINCSTAIHSASDILRILAASNDVQDRNSAAADAMPESKGLRKSSLFAAFRSPEKKVQTRKEAGMEGAMVRGMESGRLDLKTQMDIFYSAYSKFLVVNFTTLFITFHSTGIAELLYPAQARSYGPAASSNVSHVSVTGQDVFKFLTQHSSSASLPSGFKTRVKESLKRGAAISVELNLCTRRYMGFEKFAVHWTPLKDAGGRNGGGEVSWVVVTLGGVQDQWTF